MPIPTILPTPRSVQPGEGVFVLRDGVPIVLGPTADSNSAAADLASARALQSEAARLGFELPIGSHREGTAPGPHVSLRTDRPIGTSAEAYRLNVAPGRIDVEAQTSRGLRWGVETLRQLLGTRGRIPACQIEDEPSLEMRGVMLDVSRGKVPTPATVREIIDLCARLKLNVLMLYTEHTFRFHRHPKIGSEDSPLDAESMRELDAHAAEQGVELIPCLQSLGHMSHVLVHPEYASLDETGEGWTLSPADPGTYELLGDLYDEYLPNFRSRWLNANCDEPWDLCKGRSKEREAELGPGGVYLEHVHRLQELAARNGKRTMIWGDVVHAHPERIPDIDRNLVLLDWWYEPRFIDFDRVKVFAENDIEFLVCPGTSTWNCLFPRVDSSNQNIALWGEAARRHGAKGLLNTDWGDYGHYNLQGNSWFAYAMGAQHAWSGACEDRDFDRAFSRLAFGDPSGQVSRLYRELGDIHDAGFLVINASALQCLFFDDVGEATFVRLADPKLLAKAERRLERVRDRLEAAREKFGTRELTWRELCYAADASLHAARKASAGLDYLGWRRSPDEWKTPARRRLAKTLVRLADEQVALGKTLRVLWRARSYESNLDRNLRRLTKSIRGLRAAARALERNRPEPAPEPAQGSTALSPTAVLRAIRASYED